MLTIKTRVKLSLVKDAGNGLYTTEFIEKGQVIWHKTVNDIALMESEFKELKKQGLEKWVEKYGTVDKDGDWFIDGDECKFCNHSLTPNIVFLEYVGVSLIDIEPNTELLCNYYTITSKQHADKILKT